MAKESYDDLIFQLGDLSRDRLPGKPTCPRSMDRVYKAEEAVVARREELAAFEQEMNDEDAAYQAFLDEQEQEKAGHQAIVRKWKKAVDAIDGKVKDLRKTLASRRAELRYAADGLIKLEKKIADMELTRQDPARIDTARTNLKKNRLTQMRLGREVEDLDARLATALTPEPGQPGAPGILAHKRLLEMEDEAEARKEEHEARMAEIDQSIATLEEQVKAAEDYLDQALFLLGEDVYAQRIADPQLAAFYPRLDRAQ
ncbi:hypothetical protein OWM54_39590 [Myxococcus sp. MISCRS1]|jgi:hypothetical protein|uniref:hypothetical protein n=1 Tax=Myxococcus TaxID=32 RepID=UPI001CC0B1B7|nr:MULTISPECIES: hypothetical protein [unclassified Myxococcus]MBZ4398215.1 hypothetical protein [Myxococcus sp. AS-1-15]MBZ4409099.1 hypothetical protein [Myxococcus sp. XM-1-1-1]MCY1003268.1 hypothetical protein [Myxococcus sp. MISCRS1]BDT35149.1 hypothetical protein MFMH1_48180 [Myxococcus sp. MH1]